ncbi:MAG: phosphoribosylanthranilate isomerase [Acidimicrobiaceae bacterium]|nr:phosphoribosylanthranilate isomerase [Acidimicrobiaceae bacterium]
MLLDAEGLFIKVSGLTSEADTLFAIGLGANAVGFDFGPTSRQISVAVAHDIVRRLPSGVATVGVFHNEMPERIVQITNTLGLSATQVEGVISKSSLRYIAERVHTVIRVVPDRDEAYEYEADQAIDYLQLPESDLHEDMLTCLDVYSDPLLLCPLIAAGLDESSVVGVVQHYDIWGVDVLSGIESSPGVKDPVRMGEFIANARWAYNNADIARRTWPAEDSELN